jgi:hypothetical protein
MSLRTIKQLRALAHHAGLTFAEFVRGRKKERAFDAVTRDGITVTFKPKVHTDSRLPDSWTPIFKTEYR